MAIRIMLNINNIFHTPLGLIRPFSPQVGQVVIPLRPTTQPQPNNHYTLMLDTFGQRASVVLNRQEKNPALAWYENNKSHLTRKEGTHGHGRQVRKPSGHEL